MWCYLQKNNMFDVFFLFQISENQGVILPAEMEQCRGTASAFDLHVDELSDKEINILSAPVPVLRLNFLFYFVCLNVVFPISIII